MIQLNDLKFELFISEDRITSAIEKISLQLNRDYEGITPVFLGILNGAFMVASEVIKRFEGNCEVAFVKLGSYEGTTTTGNVETLLGLNQSLIGREVIVIEDIVDTGHTLTAIDKILKNHGVSGYRVVTLFFKPEAYKKKLKIDYVGMEIPNDFIVGYGLDYNGLGRNLSQIYKLKKENMTNLVLFGPPGAGKGTQASVLKDKYELIHISTGDVFRYNIKNETELGKNAKSYMDKGQLVPDDVTIKMLGAEVDKNPDAKGFIFDGFPRTAAQAEALSILLAEKNTEVSAMIALEVDDEILVERLLERGKTSGRKDDADESIIRNRIRVYYEETAILKQYYLKQDKYFGVDGVGSIDDITQRISKVIDSIQAE
ncbi:adenylate kinase [Gillisia limnaea]|uniref:Adenylate kinase n=1 Tax=Gillisia limnaea (strain DSM 15749 / LMG 21470 / R-8282) TaxID=865937 RepID=H2BYW0_GILLR|nr:adenylate kinase [Gillisia limnaea]EHQ02262.1 Adenylate kinase [Gillisia limnaea DSM 15749]